MDTLLHYLDRSSEYSHHTTRAYRTDLRLFACFLVGSYSDCAPDAIIPATIQQYKESIVPSSQPLFLGSCLLFPLCSTGFGFGEKYPPIRCRLSSVPAGKSRKLTGLRRKTA